MINDWCKLGVFKSVTQGKQSFLEVLRLQQLKHELHCTVTHQTSFRFKTVFLITLSSKCSVLNVMSLKHSDTMCITIMISAWERFPINIRVCFVRCSRSTVCSLLQ